jgi:ubiquinone/menaquinone biosynthesis C-methylase UbiE
MAGAGAITREGSERAHAWLCEKLSAYAPGLRKDAMRSLARKVAGRWAEPHGPLFVNPFRIEDLAVFDEETLGDLLASGVGGMSPEELGQALRGGPAELIERVAAQMAGEQHGRFFTEVQRDGSSEAVSGARRRLLDALFWELTYWKTPELYEELTEGEQLHPGIFERLAPELRGRVVLDAGAGSGRATLACLRAGAARVYAVEPSPGLLRLLKQKLAQERTETRARVTALRGRFDALPLPDAGVDVALSCSAFTSDPLEGGETGLAELRRVTRPGGAIVLIWPRPEDYAWLADRGFAYAALPVPEAMGVRYRSRRAALEVARRFYAGNRAVLRYLQHGEPAVPYAVLGDNPPHDYCWLTVDK